MSKIKSTEQNVSRWLGLDVHYNKKSHTYALDIDVMRLYKQLTTTDVFRAGCVYQMLHALTLPRVRSLRQESSRL